MKARELKMSRILFVKFGLLVWFVAIVEDYLDKLLGTMTARSNIHLVDRGKRKDDQSSSCVGVYKLLVQVSLELQAGLRSRHLREAHRILHVKMWRLDFRHRRDRSSRIMLCRKHRLTRLHYEINPCG